jgi:hypothetical protein
MFATRVSLIHIFSTCLLLEASLIHILSACLQLECLVYAYLVHFCCSSVVCKHFVPLLVLYTQKRLCSQLDRACNGHLFLFHRLFGPIFTMNQDFQTNRVLCTQCFCVYAQGPGGIAASSRQLLNSCMPVYVYAYKICKRIIRVHFFLRYFRMLIFPQDR